MIKGGGSMVEYPEEWLYTYWCQFCSEDNCNDCKLTPSGYEDKEVE